MTQLLGLVLISFLITSICMVPFIDLLFKLKRRFEKVEVEKKVSVNLPIHNKLMKNDELTPSGGGILLLCVLALLSLAYAYLANIQDKTILGILLFTLLSFGLLGLADDIR